MGVDNEMVRAVRLRELDNMAEHIPAEALTLRVMDLAVEGAGLELGDVLDLYAKIERHVEGPLRPELYRVHADAKTTEIAVLDDPEPITEEKPVAPEKPEQEEVATEAAPDGSERMTCKDCDETKPVAEFHRNRWGVTHVCKRCRTRKIRESKNKAKKESSKKKAEPSDPALDTKACVKCGETKPLSEYRSHIHTRDGRMHICKTCHGDGTSSGKDWPIPDSEDEDPLDYVANLRSNPKPEPKAVNYCVNGEDCAAFERTGMPTKLARDNKSGECGACARADHERLRRGERVSRR